MSTHEQNMRGIREGTKGGPGQKNQNAQAGLGAERHQGGGVIADQPRQGTSKAQGSVDPAAIDPGSVAHVEGHIYRVIELVGSSEESIEGAINSAIARAHQTIRHLRWFEIARTSGHIDEGKVRHFQVTLKVGFTMEDAL